MREVGKQTIAGPNEKGGEMMRLVLRGSCAEPYRVLA